MVTILMATYNGSQYIREQLDSIISQTYNEWELIVRDDLSVDDTALIVKEYEIKDSRIKLIDYRDEHGSATINFSVLFDYAYLHSQSYLMFADQDDIWDKNKIYESLNYIKKEELKASSELPIMVYSSFQYVDSKSEIISQELRMPRELSLPILLNENHAYGCTMILNRALVNKIRHIPKTAENHDYWVALVACTFGIALQNPQKLLNYRQHNNNVSGNVNNRKASSRLYRYVQNIDFLLPLLVKNFKMINLFYTLNKDSFNSFQHKIFGGYINAFRRNNLSLITFMLLNNFRKIGLMQTLAHYHTLFHLRRKIVNHE